MQTENEKEKRKQLKIFRLPLNVKNKIRQYIKTDSICRHFHFVFNSLRCKFLIDKPNWNHLLNLSCVIFVSRVQLVASFRGQKKTEKKRRRRRIGWLLQWRHLSTMSTQATQPHPTVSAEAATLCAVFTHVVSCAAVSFNQLMNLTENICKCSAFTFSLPQSTARFISNIRRVQYYPLYLPFRTLHDILYLHVSRLLDWIASLNIGQQTLVFPFSTKCSSASTLS